MTIKKTVKKTKPKTKVKEANEIQEVEIQEAEIQEALEAKQPPKESKKMTIIVDEADIEEMDNEDELETVEKDTSDPNKKTLIDIVNKAKELDDELDDKQIEEEHAEEEANEKPLKADEIIKKSKFSITTMLGYLTSGHFMKDCKDAGVLFNVPSKKIAKTFLQKILATIGDVLGIVINVVHNVASFIVNLLGTLLLKGTNIICKLARSLKGYLSLGYTRIA